MSRFQQRGWVNVYDTRPPIPLTVEDAPEENCLPVTGNNLRSNRNEPLGDNGAEKAFSTPNGKEPEE